MKFFAVLAVFTLACATHSHAQSADSIISAIQMVTKQSSDLNGVVSAINVVNVVFQGPKVSQGLAAIAGTVSTTVGSWAGMPVTVLSAADSANVVAVLRTFVTVHQQLLNTVIGKNGILSLFFFTEPVRVALVSIEAAVDSLAFALIDRLDAASKSDAQAQTGALDVTLQASIKTYDSGLLGTGVDTGNVLPPLALGRKMLKAAA